MTVIANGVRDLGVRVASASESGEFVIGMVGRLDDMKDQETLIRCLAYLDSGVRLELVGDGANRKSLERLSSRMGLTERVRFLGRRSDIGECVRSWDMFCFATGNREGFGIALVEAMMVGLPVVASDVAGVREVTGSGEVGVLVPVGDPLEWARAIIELRSSPSVLARVGEACRTFALDRYSEEIFAVQYLDLIISGEVAGK